MPYLALQVGGLYLVLKTADAAPGAPPTLVVKALSDTIVGLAWDRADDTDTSVQVYRQTGGSGPFTLLDTLAARENVYNDPSCDPATLYTYYVVAVNASGSSPASPTGTATTAASGATHSTATGVSATALTPWSVRVNWTDPGDVGGTHYWLIERSAGGAYAPVGFLQGVSGAQLWTDGAFNGPLLPGTTYAYRLRNIDANGYSPYAYTGSISTPARSGQPAEPSGLTVVASSDILSVVSWTDNSGGAAQTLIETAPVSGTGTPETSTFTLAGTVAAGTSTYNLTTVAMRGYYVRARCLQGGQNSGYTAPLLHTSPSTPNAGGPQTYDIGPGQTYTSIGALDWTAVGPGDTVRIHAGTGDAPYFEKFLISCRGTPSAPIRVVGINNPSGGAKPIIDGTNATTNAQFDSGVAFSYEDLSLVLIGTKNGAANGYKPGYLSLENLEIRNGYQGDNGGPANAYTAHDGSGRFYGGNATSGSGSGSGVYLAKGDHLTVRDCIIHGNGNGVFGTDSFSNNGDNRRLETVLIQGNYFYGNGTAGPTNDRQHSSYLEARGATYQFNRYGALRSGAAGASIKDRSDNCVIRYNCVEAGSLRLDIVEAQNHQMPALITPGYYKTYVYGNEVDNSVGPASQVIVYGGDSAGDWLYRRGILYAANNTTIIDSNTSQVSSLKLFVLKGGGKGSCFDVRNPVDYAQSPDGNPVSNVFLLDANGLLRLGSGWISPGYGNAATGGGTATVAGAAHLLSAAGNAPAFVNFAGADYRPTVSSPFLAAGVALAGSMPSALDTEYVAHLQSKARARATDLGYYEQGT